MKEIAAHFICRIKEDSFKMITDQTLYWTGFLYIQINDLAFLFGPVEKWLFLHGWLLLLSGRLLLLSIDLYKRFRDVKKEEWKSNVVPILKKEAIEERNKSIFQKIISTIKFFLKW
jgi:hypothetical protein